MSSTDIRTLLDHHWSASNSGDQDVEHEIYADGEPTYTVSIMRFEAGKVVHETQYFADPFPAPAWHTSLVEHDER